MAAGLAAVALGRVAADLEEEFVDGLGLLVEECSPSVRFCSSAPFILATMFSLKLVLNQQGK